MAISNYINKIKEKPEPVRKQYAFVWALVATSLVGGLWIYSLTERFNPSVKEQARADIKPFALLGETLRNTYQDISASVGSISDGSKKEEKRVTPDKVIDLIPVEPTQ